MKPRIAKDEWNSQETSIFKKGILRFDKIQHLVGGVLLGLCFGFQNATILNVLWESKDSVIPYEKYGFWGGDGFSIKDLTATQFGILFGSAIREIIIELFNLR